MTTIDPDDINYVIAELKTKLAQCKHELEHLNHVHNNLITDNALLKMNLDIMKQDVIKINDNLNQLTLCVKDDNIFKSIKIKYVFFAIAVVSSILSVFLPKEKFIELLNMLKDLI